MKQLNMTIDNLDIAGAQMAGRKGVTRPMPALNRYHMMKSSLNFAEKIDRVLREYLNLLRSSSYSEAPITIYALTTRVWGGRPGRDAAGDDDLEEVAEAISIAACALDRLSAPTAQVSTDLNRFGNDNFGKQRLNYLSKELPADRNVSRVICDTELATGIVWKMMLGSI